MRRALIIVVVVLVALIAWRAWALLSAPRPALDDYGEVADFALTERDGRTVRKADLAGKVWVAGFAFTRCTGPCPQVTGTMAQLQDELRNEPDFRLVSVSVDPEHDTPAVLTNYARAFAADATRWCFLTGPREDVDRLVIDSFHLGVQRADGQQVTHSTKLALVDRTGHVRGYFEGRQFDEEGKPTGELPKLKQAVVALLRERP